MRTKYNIGDIIVYNYLDELVFGERCKVGKISDIKVYTDIHGNSRAIYTVGYKGLGLIEEHIRLATDMENAIYGD